MWSYVLCLHLPLMQARGRPFPCFLLAPSLKPNTSPQVMNKADCCLHPSGVL